MLLLIRRTALHAANQFNNSLISFQTCNYNKFFIHLRSSTPRVRNIIWVSKWPLPYHYGFVFLHGSWLHFDSLRGFWITLICDITKWRQDNEGLKHKKEVDCTKCHSHNHSWADLLSVHRNFPFYDGRKLLRLNSIRLDFGVLACIIFCVHCEEASPQSRQHASKRRRRATFKKVPPFLHHRIYRCNGVFYCLVLNHQCGCRR